MNIGAYTVGDFTVFGEVSKHSRTNIGKLSNDSSSFGDVLNEVDSAVDDYSAANKWINAPARWTSEHLYTYDENTSEGYTVNREAISRVKEQLKAEGIDANSRTPTHKITDEQMEWLSSRYDLDFLNACSHTHEEYGNFMLDLAYLNVFSLDEIENMYGVMPFNENHKGYLYKMDTGDGLSGFVNPFGGIGNYVDQENLYTQLIMEYLRVKFTGRTEKEYEQMAKDYVTQRTERMSIIKDFFDRAASRKDDNMGGAKPSIENISEKLKEDFGGLM